METRKILNEMSAEEQEEMLKALTEKKQTEKRDRREAYEGLRSEFMHEVFGKLEPTTDTVTGFKDWLQTECDSFYGIMRQYGTLKNDGQASWTVQDGDRKLEVKSNNVKGFDERADMAAEKLTDYLKRYALRSDKGTDDAIYQLAMKLLERNHQGDLDYKSISTLYAMEDKFDGEYKAIMDLFRESNVVQKTAVNYYFSKKDKNGVWRRIEPSFCRI